MTAKPLDMRTPGWMAAARWMAIGTAREALIKAGFKPWLCSADQALDMLLHVASEQPHLLAVKWYRHRTVQDDRAFRREWYLCQHQLDNRLVRHG